MRGFWHWLRHCTHGLLTNRLPEETARRSVIEDSNLWELKETAFLI
jgi:hypothetical protein